MKNKKVILLIVVTFMIAICIISYFLLKNTNKNLNLGNNLSNKTLEEIEEYILNISSYEAEIEVQVESNKNQTKYVLEQKYVNPNVGKQIVKQPTNIQDLEITHDGNKLTIHNSKLNLTKVYENYPYLTDNFLWLNSFIEDYKKAKSSGKSTKLYEENNQIIMETILENQNPYIRSKKLMIDKQTGNIQKLIVQDKNQKNIVYILYKEMKVDKLKKEEVLAFRLKENIMQY